MTTMNMIEIGDCRETMRSWAAAGIRAQTCVTSPPYFGLRSYMPDAVKLRGDIDPEKLASVLKELDSLGIRGVEPVACLRALPPMDSFKKECEP